jgi:hypothetical protein
LKKSNCGGAPRSKAAGYLRIIKRSLKNFATGGEKARKQLKPQEMNNGNNIGKS